MENEKVKNVRWNGEPAFGRKVYVRVGTVEKPTWWCAGMEGTRRKAVEVEYEGQVFYLDNEDGRGWSKVTRGLGSPRFGHNSLPDDSRVVGCDHWFNPAKCVFCDATKTDEGITYPEREVKPDGR